MNERSDNPRQSNEFDDLTIDDDGTIRMSRPAWCTDEAWRELGDAVRVATMAKIEQIHSRSAPRTTLPPAPACPSWCTKHLGCCGEWDEVFGSEGVVTEFWRIYSGEIATVNMDEGGVVVRLEQEFGDDPTGNQISPDVYVARPRVALHFMAEISYATPTEARALMAAIESAVSRAEATL